MKFKTITLKEGERLGDIDWNFQFYHDFLDRVVVARVITKSQDTITKQ